MDACVQQTLGSVHRAFSNALSGAHKPRRMWRQGILGGAGYAPKRVSFSPPMAAIIPGDTVAEQVFTTGIQNFLRLYNTALVVRLVLTWFPNPPQIIVGPLSTLCDPYLNLFRGIIPPLGGTLDFSPILAFVLLSVFTNTAAALPCELGPDDEVAGASNSSQRANKQPKGMLDWLPASKYQRAWAQRMFGAKQLQQHQ
eukprot:GHUV01002282.1.p1 GENE.GHUV01002282.1~~GHUV01002282.1.p1  ORF type:complete len:198 (+),score=52.08 GHUV01002282.1:249-842(+)